MGEKIMVKGTEAIGEAAIRAGCTVYFGYPITPQSELTEYMARRECPKKAEFFSRQKVRFQRLI